MDQSKYRPYDISIQMLSENGYFQPKCNTVIFWNQGTGVVTIDSNMVLDPPDPATGKEGVAFTWEGYPGEINIHSYSIVFAPLDPKGQPAVNKLCVNMKMYQE